MPYFEVSAAYLAPALEVALAEGLRAGLPPAAALVDLAPMLGLSELKPSGKKSSDAKSGPGDFTSLSALADPEGVLASMKAPQLGRLIGKSRDWPLYFEMVESWFSTDAALMEDLEDATNATSVKRAVWKHLEERRPWWAIHFARSALILRYADDVAPKGWQSFLAVAGGLQDGRPMRKLPIFEEIVDLTLARAAGRTRPMEGVAAFGGEFDDDFYEEAPDVQTEAKGELARLLKGTGATPEMINGYLTAVLIAPEHIMPDAWLLPLLKRAPVREQAALQRLLDIMMIRYSAIDDALVDGDIGTELRRYSQPKFGN